MVTKRVPITRRHRTSSEAFAWYAYFAWQRDYFGDLHRRGLTVEEMEAQAEDAWRRLGKRFLMQWRIDEGDRREPREPWALEQFGGP